MPPWIVKAAIQGTLSLLPNPQRWNYRFQKHVTRSVDLNDAYFLMKWAQCKRHLDNLRGAHGDGGASHVPFVALELGTGWFPIIPVGLALLGAGRVYSVDTQKLLSHDRLTQTLRYYANCMKDGRVQPGRPEAESRIARVLDVAPKLSTGELLSELGIELLVTDARRLSLQSSSVDLICSNNTLEHIPPTIIVDIFREFNRVAAGGGLMSHHIDLADHYANFDPSITVYNFLKYSDFTWRFFNNELQYQNRLRISDFRELHEATGWQLLAEDSRRKAPAELAAIKLATRFRSYSELDLLVYDTWLVSQRANRA